MATAMNVCVLSWKSGKRRVFLTFSQSLVFFPVRKYFEKFAIQRREGGAARAKSPQKPILKLYSNTNLTIHVNFPGGKP